MSAPNIRKFRPRDPNYMTKLRERTGMDRTQWATALGKCERTIRNIERGAYGYDYALQYLAENIT